MAECERCFGEITYGYLFDMPFGVVCKECFLAYWQKHMSEEEWDEKYNGSVTDLADLLDITYWDVESYIEERREAIEEAKWESWEDR